MLKIIKDKTPELETFLKAINNRAKGNSDEIRRAVAELCADIEKRGDAAIEEISLKFDGAKPRRITSPEMEKAALEIEPEQLKSLELSTQNIRDYQTELLPKNNTVIWENSEGGNVGELITPLETVGVYVPGGTAAYPSSVLMSVVPASVAGVKNIIVATPPTENLSNEVLAAAKISGADEIFAVGGVAAIGAMALGLCGIPKCDKIVGPGNAYVQEAKRYFFGETGIDSFAGPSEILVITDETTNPDIVAADLLSQAEHDVLASSVLLCQTEEYAEKVQVCVAKRAEKLPRKDIISKSLENYSAIIICKDIQKCFELSNKIAPEHLEILAENPRNYLTLVQNAGAVFLNSPEPLGDYWAGPSHVLPTSGTARYASALSVHTFLKRTSIIDYDQAAIERVYKPIAAFARAEQLEAHAQSIESRFL